MGLRNWLKGLKPKIGIDNENNRHLWVERVLRNLPAGARILDAGAGPQQYRRFCAHLEYVSQDFAQYDGKGDSAALQVPDFVSANVDIVSDITAIPEPNSSFDSILCTEVLEHVPDPIAAVKEFSRLLKAGGLLILTAPFCSLTHFSPYHFSTGFSRYWYERHLSDNGFQILNIEPNGNYFAYVSQELSRTRQVSSKYAGRNLGLFDRFATMIVQSALARLQRAEKGSSELLCYGYHVIARKI